MAPSEFALESASRRFPGAHESSAAAGSYFLRHVLDENFGGTVDGGNFSKAFRSLRREGGRTFYLHLLDGESCRTPGRRFLRRAWTQRRRQDRDDDRAHATGAGFRSNTEARSAFARLAREMGTVGREISQR